MIAHLPPGSPEEFEALEARFALRACAHLHDACAGLSPDVQTRLRFAREQALERASCLRKRQSAVAATAPIGWGSSAAVLGSSSRQGEERPWRLGFALLLPALALLLGLMSIEFNHSSDEITAAAEIDAAILADDLPPEAYRDAAFVEFLKSPVIE